MKYEVSKTPRGVLISGLLFPKGTKVVWEEQQQYTFSGETGGFIHTGYRITSPVDGVSYLAGTKEALQSALERILEE